MARKIVTCLTALLLTGLMFFGHHKASFTQNLAPVAFRNVQAIEKDFPWDTVVGYKTLKWQSCYESEFQCTRLLVPLNYSDPEGEQAGIALIRKRATVPPPLYRGPILINPGGPGESGVDIVRIAGRLFSTIVGPQFDVIGFDPRGVARSQPRVSFYKTEIERELWLAGVNLITGSPESVSRAWARSHVLGRLTAENDGGYLPHINTDQTARDMLHIVSAHGRTKLQYWGFSYGTVLGATFAAMFPDKVERIILDGVVDAENYYASLWSNNLSDTDRAMDHFYTGCANAGPDNCAFWAPTPDDIQKNLTILYDILRVHPKPVRTKFGYGILDYKMLHSAVFGSLYKPYGSFPELAQGLAALAAGDGSLLFDMMNPPPFECPCGSPEPLFARVDDGVAAIHCNDGDEVPTDLESMQKYVDMMTKSSPNWGGAWSRIRMECVGWPKFSQSHFQGPFDANTSHPILLIGNTADPVTPLALATKMSLKFPGSVVLTQDSVGHCSLAAPSICTMKYIEDYFVKGNLPEQGTVCQTEMGPFPIATIERNSEDDSQATFINMSTREREIYDAIMDFINTPSRSMIPPGLLALPSVSDTGTRCSV